MTNNEFLEMIRASFKDYLEVGTSRSTNKLKSLHGLIAKDILARLGEEFFIQSQGIYDDREGEIQGRYYPKRVDITVKYNDKPVAGFAIKFVMRNYSQNNINYFENMLGETANIRSNSIPYFQIFIVFDKVPYYKNDGELTKWESISQHLLAKYEALSTDDPRSYLHTPDKTLFVLLHLAETDESETSFENSEEYATYYKLHINDPQLIMFSDKFQDNFGDTVILNDYNNFLDRCIHIIKGHLK